MTTFAKLLSEPEVFKPSGLLLTSFIKEARGEVLLSLSGKDCCFSICILEERATDDLESIIGHVAISLNVS